MLDAWWKAHELETYFGLVCFGVCLVLMVVWIAVGWNRKT
jgi:hypothetical protein